MQPTSPTLKEIDQFLVTGFSARTKNSDELNAGHYLVFQGVGPMPLAVIETWQRIWNYFTTNDEYQRRYLSDFEIYNAPDEVTIYIGINNVDKLSAKG